VEFTALLEQQALTVTDVIDVLCGAFDAHWQAHLTKKQENPMQTHAWRMRVILLLAIGAVLMLRSTLRSDVVLVGVDLVGVAGIVSLLLGWWGGTRHHTTHHHAA